MRNRQISPERKGLFTLGTALMAIGAVTIAVGFIGFVTAAKGLAAGTSNIEVVMVDGQPVAVPGSERSSPFDKWLTALIGMVIVGVGSALRHVAARGVAGSGLVLDPERAGTDLEPWARMGGRMLADAVDESGLPLGQGPAATQVAPDVKVRCPKCRALNDEAAKFCSQCATAL